PHGIGLRTGTVDRANGCRRQFRGAPTQPLPVDRLPRSGDHFVCRDRYDLALLAGSGAASVQRNAVAGEGGAEARGGNTARRECDLRRWRRTANPASTQQIPDPASDRWRRIEPGDGPRRGCSETLKKQWIVRACKHDRVGAAAAVLDEAAGNFLLDRDVGYRVASEL